MDEAFAWIFDISQAWTFHFGNWVFDPQRTLLKPSMRTVMSVYIWSHESLWDISLKELEKNHSHLIVNLYEPLDMINVSGDKINQNHWECHIKALEIKLMSNAHSSSGSPDAFPISFFVALPTCAILKRVVQQCSTPTKSGPKDTITHRPVPKSSMPWSYRLSNRLWAALLRNSGSLGSTDWFS